MGPVRQLKRRSRLPVVAGICLLLAAAGIGSATSPVWAEEKLPSEASEPMRSVSGLAVPVPQPLELGVTPLDGATGVNPASLPAFKAVNGRVPVEPLEGFGDWNIPWTVYAKR